MYNIRLTFNVKNYIIDIIMGKYAKKTYFFKSIMKGMALYEQTRVKRKGI